MNYVDVVSVPDGGLAATPVVTAGILATQLHAGDPAGWRERNTAWEKANPFRGTINTMLLLNQCGIAAAAEGDMKPLTWASAHVKLERGKSRCAVRRSRLCAGKWPRTALCARVLHVLAGSA